MVTPISKYFTNPENSTCVVLRMGINRGLEDWLKENCKGLWTNQRDKFYFSKPTDAATFKMVWG